MFVLLLLSHSRFGLALRTLPAAPARLFGRGRRGTATAAAQLRMSTYEYADGLPIAALLPEVVSSLRAEPNLVLEAPPGAGKTTTVPLALLRGDGADAWSDGGDGGDGSSAGLIMVLEPRRVAARGAAHRMASLLGQAVGGEVGYTVLTLTLTLTLILPLSLPLPLPLTLTRRRVSPALPRCEKMRLCSDRAPSAMG